MLLLSSFYTAGSNHCSYNNKTILYNTRAYSVHIYFFFLIGGVLIGCLGLFSNPAWCSLGQNLSVGSAKAMALGNAVTADPPGIDAIHFNPAGLAQLKGRQYQLKSVAAHLDVSADFYSTNAYDLQLNLFEFEDRYANSSSQADGLAILLPGDKIVKLGDIAGGMLGGVSYSPPGSDFTFATATYATLIGGVYHSNDNDPGVFSGRTRAVTRLTYLSPSIGYQLTDQLAIGGSLGFSYTGLALDIDLRFPNALITGVGGFSNALCGNNTTFGPCAGELSPVESLANIDFIIDDPYSQTFNIGLLWQPNPWLTWGIVYQSASRDTLEGDIRISYSEELVDYLQGFRNLTDETLFEIGLDLLRFPDNLEADQSTARVNLDYPAHFSTGLSIQLTPKWKINTDLKWTELGNWDEVTLELAEDSEMLEFLGVLIDIVGADLIEGTNDITAEGIVLSRGWKDVWNIAFGAEYQVNRSLALRFGYEPRRSAIPPNRLDYIVPLGEAQWFSFGAHYKVTQYSEWDFAIGLLRSKAFIPNGSSTNLNATNLTNFIYNPYAGQDVQTELSVSIVSFSYQSQF